MVVGRNIPLELGQGIAAQILGEWWNIGMTGLLHNVDLDRAMKCMKPHTMYCGMEWWLKVKDSFQVLEGVEEGSLKQQALNIQIGHAHGRVPCRVEVNDGEVVVTVTECWSAKFPYPFGWCASHEYFFEGNCKAINPEHSISFAQRIADGHPTCRIIVRDKESPAKNQNTGRASTLLPDLQLSDEQINSKSVTLLSLFWMTTMDALIDAVGEKATIDIVKPCMFKSGEAWGLKLGEMIQHKEGEKGVADLLDLFSQIMRLDGDLFVNQGRVDKVIDSCPFASAPEPVCILYDAFVEGLCRSIDPELVFVGRKISCSSSTFCHWKLEIMPKERPGEKARIEMGSRPV
jgi:hypothetical protein